MNISELTLLSIGCGLKPQYLTVRDGSWGLGRWAFKLLDLLNDANVGLPHYQCDQLLGERYERLNPPLSEYVALDDASKVDFLIQTADDFPLERALKFIDREWMGVTNPRPMGDDVRERVPYAPKGPQPGAV